MTLLAKALSRFRDTLDEVQEVSKTLAFDSSNQQHLLAISLHGSVLEYARGIMILLQNGDATCTFVVLRSLLEAAVDLFNLAATPRYAEFMQYTFLNEKRRLLKAAVQAPNANPYLADFAERSTDTSAYLEQVCAEMEQLEKKQIRWLSACERFERAQRSDLYHGPYWDLCLHTHNNIAALEQRHLHQTSSGFQVAYFRPPSEEDVQLTLDTAAGLVANSIEFLSQLLGGSSSGLEGVTHTLGELRALWRQHT